MEDLITEIRSCTLCAANLPLGPNPIVAASSTSKLMIIGQAPGKRVHETSVPWDDPSGRQLRAWLDMDDAAFYDPAVVALVPMGFCYPGSGKSGDLPPRPECAATWHDRIRDALPEVQLTLLIGQYAQRHYLGNRMGTNLTETVRRFGDYLPQYLPLPHPSPRNRIWMKRNPWFDAEVLPELRRRAHTALQSS